LRTARTWTRIRDERSWPGPDPQPALHEFKILPLTPPLEHPVVHAADSHCAVTSVGEQSIAFVAQ
jgi:hypothetical protein